MFPSVSSSFKSTSPSIPMLCAVSVPLTVKFCDTFVSSLKRTTPVPLSPNSKLLFDDLVLILSPIFLLMITNYFVETNSTKTFDNSSFNPMNYIFSANIFLIFKNFISMQSIIYFPNVKYSLNFSFIFSIFQNLIIIFQLHLKKLLLSEQNKH